MPLTAFSSYKVIFIINIYDCHEARDKIFLYKSCNIGNFRSHLFCKYFYCIVVNLCDLVYQCMMCRLYMSFIINC